MSFVLFTSSLVFGFFAVVEGTLIERYKPDNERYKVKALVFYCIALFLAFVAGALSHE